MERITRKKNDNFTVIDNTILKDKRLSLKAKGLHTLIMGLPNNWDFSINGIVAISKEGRDAILTGVRELIKFGYCTKKKIRQEGKFGGVDYTFYEIPKGTTPQREKPFTDNPFTDYPLQLSTQLIKNEINKESNTPPFNKKENSNTEQPNTNTLKDTHSLLNSHEGATLQNKAAEPKEVKTETNSNNTVKPTETASEQTNATKVVCLYTSVAKMALNSYNEIAKRKYTFKRHGSVITKRLKVEFSKEEIQDPNTFELIKTMLEVKWQDTTPDSKGFAQLPIKNYEPKTLFSPSKFSTYIQAAENTLIQTQNRKQKAAENQNINPFLGII